MSVDINISNYEEFLLSYIDGELNNEEKTALEAFLQQHPQQAGELEIFKSAILKPDTAEVFENKTALYRSTVITLENYEPFLLSYIDGELNPAETTAMEAFLQKHPHVAQELDTWLATRLPAGDAIPFEHKEMLYRHADTLTPDNYETYFLSYIDGELTAAEEQTLLQFLQQHPELQGALELLQRTRLQADASLRMPGKAALYRHSATRVRMRPLWWAAAAVAAGAFLFWLLPLRPGVPEGAQVAVQQPVPVIPQPENLQKSAPVHMPGTPPAAPPQVMDNESAALAQDNTPAPEKHPLVAKNNTPVKRTVTQQTPVTANPSARVSAAAGNAANNSNNNSSMPVLSQLPQPRATSAEIVQQRLEKQGQDAAVPTSPQDVAVSNTTGNQVLASSTKLPHTPVPETAPPAAAPAEVQGELIMSVTSTNESKLLNGVANVAKFFSRKRHQK